MYVQIQSEKFVDFQRELFEEFVADFLDQAKDPSLSTQDIEALLQSQLQNLNQKLQSFAEKLRDVPKCEIRGYVQVMVNQTVLIWMIGKSTLLYFRDGKLLTELENSYQEQALIDQFVDFIWGEFEAGDVFMYGGTKLSEIMDHQDLNDIEQILTDETAETMLNHLEETLTARVEKTEIWFLSTFSISALQLTSSLQPKKAKVWAVMQQYAKKFANKLDLDAIKHRTQRYFKGNTQYYIIAWVLGFLVILLGYAVLSQFRGTKAGVEYQTGTGGVAYLTLDEINADIFAFNILDPSTDEKSQKYSEILQKLQILESKGKWPEDVKKLRENLNAAYERGFNVIAIKDMAQFDDNQNAIRSKVLAFTDMEKQKIWSPISLDIGAQMNIAGTRAAIIGSVNESTRGSLVEYNTASDAKDCSLSLSKKGLFCYTPTGELFYVGKSGVELMETTDGQWSTSDIGGISTYNKNSMYLFQHSPNNFASVFLTRYQNIAGSESKYRAGQNYTVLTASGASLPAEMNGFVIDGNFMAWGDGKLYQFWRASNVAAKLDYREVALGGGEKVSSVYSNNVKVITTDNSPYVYLFDKDNQTFTVYKSTPPKTNENHKTNFNLRYVLRFKFDLSAQGSRVVDAEVPPTNDEKRELYLLTTEGVHKVDLYKFFERVKAPMA